MKFYFNGPMSTASVEGVPISMSCTMPSGIQWAAWNETQGVSIPSSGIQIQTTFTDPSPYQALVNAWITAQAAATPALSLAQAQAIKSAMAADIFKVQRQAQISYAIGSTDYNWDCSDESVGAMGLALAEVVSGISENFGLQNNLGIDDTLAFSPDNLTIQTTSCGCGEQTTLVTPSTDGGKTLGLTGSVSLTGSMSLTGGLSLPNVSWIPIGATAPITLTGAQFAGLAAAVSSRRLTLLQNKLSLQANISAASSVSAVIAIDVTQGW